MLHYCYHQCIHLQNFISIYDIEHEIEVSSHNGLLKARGTGIRPVV